ncbi:hypothetical protein NFA_18980 [Nocardia farcinica IFM 10152]|uniref:Uncharacterized protein n=1 Tax=Nocardia farcinica (strain IFM 10152) TaxID=247156 RepID=Q5YYJ7_NOCFA|nr:hypothetical protein NFA_18980 [Nocardia farcinica IFM 10152]
MRKTPVRVDRGLVVTWVERCRREWHQLAAAGTQRDVAMAGRRRIAEKLCRAGLTNEVNHERRCSASAAATAGISRQCTRPGVPRRWRPAWLLLMPNGVPLLAGIGLDRHGED